MSGEAARLACLRLIRSEGVGSASYRRLIRRFGSASAALEALPGLARRAGRDRAPRIPEPAAIEAELDGVGRLGGRMLILGEAAYPPLLAQLEDAPAAIAVLGDARLLQARSVAMVGARNASSNGLRMAEMLAAELGVGAAADRLAVVSGLARGIDAAAHEGAIHLGRTIACIAGGLDQPYPPEHAGLQARIAEHGAVVAEAPLGTVPGRWHFPQRNRIIAGLSLGCVVVEAAPKSGSLITAEFAQTYGRELFAVPGSPLDPRSRGANNLLRQGAILVESAADIRAGLPESLPRLGADGFAEPAEPFAFGAPDEDDPATAGARVRLLELLGPVAVPVDDLLRRCQFSTAAVLAALTELELAGQVEALPGNRVSLLAGCPDASP